MAPLIVVNREGREHRNRGLTWQIYSNHWLTQVSVACVHVRRIPGARLAMKMICDCSNNIQQLVIYNYPQLGRFLPMKNGGCTITEGRSWYGSWGLIWRGSKPPLRPKFLLSESGLVMARLGHFCRWKSCLKSHSPIDQNQLKSPFDKIGYTLDSFYIQYISLYM